MEKIAILVDTSSDITPEMAKEFGIYLIPLYINLDDKSYKEQFEIDQETLNEWIISNKNKFAKTSTASPAEVMAMYEKIKADGYEKAIFITISSTLSSFSQMARLVEIEDFEVEVIDSESIAMGEGLLAIYAKDLVDKSFSFYEIVDKLEEIKSRRDILVWFSTMKYLKAGGRMGQAASKIINAFQLSPLIEINEKGHISIKKAKMKKEKALAELVELAKDKLKDVDRYYFVISDEDFPEGVEYLKENLKEVIDKSERFIETKLCPTISVNVGPGAVGFLYVIIE